MKLISMTEFVLQNKNQYEGYSTEEYGKFSYNHTVRLEAYATFLTQPLTIGMFVPADLDGNVLEQIEIQPSQDDYWSDNNTVFSGQKFLFHVKRYKAYQTAKERVLFDGFKADYYNRDSLANNGGSYQIISEDGKIQICIYKSQPDYFIWNNDGKKEHPTIEYLVKYNLTLTPQAQANIR